MKIVYILESLKDKRIYTGNTDNLEERIKLHNNGLVESTKYRRPLELVCCITFKQDKTAYNFERYLKTGSGRAFINKHFR